MQTRTTRLETTVQTTRKTNQVDICLDRIQDPAVRDALAGILTLVNYIVGTGIDTQGTLKARNGISSGLAEDTGLVMWTVKKGKLLPDSGAEDHFEKVGVPGRILGVNGWSQFEGTEAWRGMGRTTSSGTVFLSVESGAPPSLENTVVFQNADAVNSNAYRAIIFYQPYDIDRQRGFL
jgi:hypothetical protein